VYLALFLAADLAVGVGDQAERAAAGGIEQVGNVPGSDAPQAQKVRLWDLVPIAPLVPIPILSLYQSGPRRRPGITSTRCTQIGEQPKKACAPTSSPTYWQVPENTHQSPFFHAVFMAGPGGPAPTSVYVSEYTHPMIGRQMS
jgi:hypothetical protein